MLSIFGIFIAFDIEMLRIEAPIPIIFIVLVSVIVFLFPIKKSINEQFFTYMYLILAILLPFLILFAFGTTPLAYTALFMLPGVSLPTLAPLIHAILFVIFIMKAKQKTERLFTFYGMSISVISTVILILLLCTHLINPSRFFNFIF